MSNRDLYSGLLSRREREWLIRIQMMQLQTGEPYQDDYYFTMHKKKQKEGSESRRSPEPLVLRLKEQENGSAQPYIYVPPKFEGSLGKVQVLSANFPRQLIDVGSSEGASSSLPSLFALRRFKLLLMEVEKLLGVVLQYQDRSRLLPEASSSEREELCAALCGDVAELCLRVRGERLQMVLGIRKGRRLVARLLSLLDKDQSVLILTDLLTFLPKIAKKDSGDELLTLLFPGIFDSAKRLSKEQLSQVISALSPQSLEFSFSFNSKFAFCLVLLLMCHCSRKRVPDEKELSSVTAAWTRLVVLRPSESPDWLTADHLTCLGQWLSSQMRLSPTEVEPLVEILTRK